jgi:hypothetical protein
LPSSLGIKGHGSSVIAVRDRTMSWRSNVGNG